MKRIVSPGTLFSVVVMALLLIILPGCEGKEHEDDDEMEMTEGRHEGMREDDDEDHDGMEEDDDEGDEGMENEASEAGGDEAMDFADLPAAVRDAFESAYPNAGILSASAEEEGGETVYEIESRDGDQRRDLVYHANGTVATLEEIVQVAALPAAVRAAAQATGTIIQAEHVVEGRMDFYEIVVEHDGTRKSINLDASGKPLKG
jgi:hypothetical protein